MSTNDGPKRKRRSLGSVAMISLQTNVISLMAQENLRATSLLQGKTIQRLTSGFRITSSGTMRRGLLSNITQLLDRAVTLATQSASDTFTGDRTVLNSEYQQVQSEITRQAGNVGLNLGGDLNKLMEPATSIPPTLSGFSIAIRAIRRIIPSLCPSNRSSWRQRRDGHNPKFLVGYL